MAPGTNLGAATPVQIGGAPARPQGEPRAGKRGGKDGAGGAAEREEIASADTLTRKVTHDAAAYIRSLAQLRGRNAEWGEQAVREAVSLSAADALKRKVIDVVAHDVPDLLKKIDGRKLSVQGGERALRTADAQTIAIAPDWRSEVLAVIANPSVALILMMIGIYGLLFEFANPGFVAPGVIGGICLLLAFYAFQLLPINYAGVGLILLGMIFLVAEAFVPSFGALGIGGVVAFVVGSIILFDVDGGTIAVSLPLVGAAATLTAGLTLIALRALFSAHRRPVVSGAEELVGSAGEAEEDFERRGRVHVHGESWTAESGSAIRRGERVRVTGRDGLILKIEPEEKPK
jgi:membrane-bound serine protease (ClpP class)